MLPLLATAVTGAVLVVATAVLVPLARLPDAAAERAFWAAPSTAQLLVRHGTFCAVMQLVEVAGFAHKVSQVVAEPSFGELRRAGGLGALQRLTTSPWAWPPLFIATALLQLLLIGTRPVSWWARRRHGWMLANRTLRGAFVMATMASGSVGAGHGTILELVLLHTRSMARRSGPVAAALSVLATWSGVLTMTVHNAVAWLPVRWTPALQLPMTLALVHVHAIPMAKLLQDPAVLPGYTQVCGVLVGVVGELTGASTLGSHNAELCKSIHPLPVVVFFIVAFGYIANLVLLVLWERALKHKYAESVAAAAAAAAALAQQAGGGRIGSGSDVNAGHDGSGSVPRPATTPRVDEHTVNRAGPSVARGAPPKQ